MARSSALPGYHPDGLEHLSCSELDMWCRFRGVRDREGHPLDRRETGQVKEDATSRHPTLEPPGPATTSA